MSQASKSPYFTKRVKSFKRLIKTPLFVRLYPIGSLLILFGTTLVWSLLGAKLQQGNADQLVNTALLDKGLHQANLPAAHSLLLKWPLFWLIKLFGASAAAFITITVISVLLTVAGLTFVLYRLERRKLMFGTLCLALASVLLLVPPQPYAGALLPVNMAMLATRNLEYLFYLGGLALLVGSSGLKSRRFWLGAFLLAVLGASDKLFLVLGLGGALVALVVYVYARSWNLASRAVDWLAMMLVAGLAALGVLAMVSAGHITHLLGQSTSPYALVGKFSDVVLGGFYAVLAILTNLGANPAYDATQVRHVPHQLVSHLASVGGPAYIVNALILVAGGYALLRLFIVGLGIRKGRPPRSNKSGLLAMMLAWTTLAAVVSFVLTNHYYAVDARYLTISLFTVFVGLAAYTRGRRWRPELVVALGGILMVSIFLGVLTSARTYSDDKAALASQNERNTLVAQVLTRHPVKVLVGDYWRVLPTRLAADNKLNVMPLSDCTQPRQVLSSQAWQLDLHHRSFAYLLTLEGSLTDFPNCNLEQVVRAYGRPNTSVLIDGTLKHPKELLLFYDQGVRPAPPSPAATQAPATVLPIPLDQLTGTACPVPTVATVVAHQDDDLLFTSPDLLHALKASYCVRTIYVTAGDDGAGRFYWLNREQGSQAAYAAMLGMPDVWIQRIVELSDHEFVTIASLKGNSRVSLIFMHLPDGNLKGEGFASSHNESLAKLASGHLERIHTVDGQSYYSSSDLVESLSKLLNIYQATEIRTQASLMSGVFPDHSDHMTVGHFVKLAYQKYEHDRYANQVVIPLKLYIGYPVHQMPPNVGGADLQNKEVTFLTYAKYDTGVCQTAQECDSTPTYHAYLMRQYENSY